jgi:glycosyltransferase involved in cell wall biosynthesis/Flp pilus assembly protein TadD/GT2 family glycosyltransferase/ferredoxin
MTGVSAVCEAEGAEIVDFSTSGASPLMINPKAGTEALVTNALLDADGIINVPKAKTHVFTYFTGALKNLYGVIPGLKKAEYHKEFPGITEFSGFLNDLNDALASKTRLVVMDAVWGMEGNGPTAGRKKRGNFIAAGCDNVCVDLMTCSLLGLDASQSLPLVEGATRWFGDGAIHLNNAGDAAGTIQPEPFTPPIHESQEAFINAYGSILPVLKRDKCVQCGKCVRACPVQAIKDFAIQADECIKCLCCFEMCPNGAINLVRPSSPVCQTNRITSDPVAAHTDHRGAGTSTANCPMGTDNGIAKPLPVEQADVPADSMNLLVIANLYPPHYIGGYELACRDIAEGLLVRGHQITILTSMYGVDKPLDEKIRSGGKEGWTYHVLRRLDHSYGEFQKGLDQDNFSSAYNEHIITECLTDLSPDLIYLWNFHGLSMRSVLRVIRKHRIPAVHHAMDYHLAPDEPLSDHLKEEVGLFLSNSKSCTIAMSDVVASKFKRSNALNLERIYHGVPRARSCNKSEQVRRFLYVGQMQIGKGVHLILEAVQKLTSSGLDLEVDVYGDGNIQYTQLLQKHIEANRLPIRLMGRIEREAVLNLYPQYDALLMPTIREEPFGIVMIEAMAAGLPVIASNHGGPSEIIQDNVSGMLFQNRNKDDLAKKINTIYSDNALYRRIKTNAQNVVEENFLIEHSVVRIEKCLMGHLQNVSDSPGVATNKATPATRNASITETSITWVLDLYGPTGYAECARNTMMALDRLGIHQAAMSLTPKRSALSEEIDAFTTKVANAERKKDVLIIHHPPALHDGSDYYKAIKNRCPGYCKYIASTVFETNAIPPSWVTPLNNMDEIWVPSEFNVETFRKAGVRPDLIKIVPYGFDPKPFNPDQVPPLELPGCNGFVFLSVFEWAHRKGWDVLIEAYFKAFKDEDDVTLVVKCLPNQSEQVKRDAATLMERLKVDPGCQPNIVFLNTVFNKNELASLYQRADAFVLPSRGEGWGMPYIEAMCMGKPTIGTRWGGQLTFMNDENAYLIDIDGLRPVSESQTRFNPFYLDQLYAEPSLDDLVQIFRQVYTDRIAAAQRGDRARLDILNHWTATKAAKVIYERLLPAETSTSSAQHGDERQATKILFVAPIFDPSGYADEARNFILNLHARGVDIGVQAIGRHSKKFFDTAEEDLKLQLLKALGKKIPSPSIEITEFPASGFKKRSSAPYHVGRTMYETDRLPESWVQNCNLVDEVWVPTKFNLSTFKQSGVTTRMVVIPGGVDVDRFRPGLDPLPIEGLRGTVFLSVFEWIYRKGWDVLLTAWANAFGPNDDVSLLLRAYPQNDTEGLSAQGYINYQIEAHLKSIGMLREMVAPIVLIGDQIPDGDMPRLYNAADVYVSPTRGEGWGKPFIEAMACGMPTIATRWSGHLEYMTDENSILLEIEGTEPVDANCEISHYRGHRWAKPSVAHLTQIFREIATGHLDTKTIGKRARTEISASWTWQHAADKAYQRLLAIEEERAMTKPVKGVQSRRLNICWEGEQFRQNSLANVNREFCSRLAKSAHVNLNVLPVRYTSDRETAASATDALIADHVVDCAPPQTDIHVRHHWPPNFNAPQAGHWVLVQPWEFGSLPKSWIEPIQNQIDEVWVYSQYVRQVYIDSGVSPENIEVIPLAVDHKVFHPDVPSYDLPTQKKLKLLFVGGTIWRKGIDILLDVYSQTFTGDDDICLVIKDQGGDSFYRGQTAQERIETLQNTEGAPEIIYLDDTLTVEELASLYKSCDCLVHPFRGEGFALTVAEAMACGTAPIVTGGGACDDYCHPGNAFLLESKKSEVRMKEMELAKPGWVLEPDRNHLARTLRHVFAHREELEQLGTTAASSIREQLSWENSCDHIIQRFNALVVQPLRRENTLETKKDRLRNSCVDCANANELEALYAELLGCISPKTLEEQIDSLKSFTVEHPDFGLALNDLGVLIQHTDQWTAADSYFERAVTLEPANMLFRKNYADYSYARTQDYKKALSEYLAALRSNPTDTEVLYGLALLSRDIGCPQDAEVFCDRVLQIDPVNAAAQILQQALLGHTGATVRAEMSKSIPSEEQQKSEDERLNDFAVECYSQGRHKEALQAYRRAHAINPANAVIIKNLADFLYVVADAPGEALKLYNQALELDAQDIDALFAIGKISFEAGELSSAQFFFDKVCEYQKDHALALGFLELIEAASNGLTAGKSTLSRASSSTLPPSGANPSSLGLQFGLRLPVYIVQEGGLDQLGKCVQHLVQNYCGAQITVITHDPVAHETLSAMIDEGRCKLHLLKKKEGSLLEALNALIRDNQVEACFVCSDAVEVLDDIFTPMQMLLASSPHIGVVAPDSSKNNARNADTSDNEMSRDMDAYSSAHLTDFLRLQSIRQKHLSSSCALLKTEAFKKIGGFDNGMASLDEALADWSFRARIHHYDTLLAPGLQVGRITASGTTIPQAEALNKKWRHRQVEPAVQSALKEIFYLDNATKAFLEGRMEELHAYAIEWLEAGGTHAYSRRNIVSLLINASMYDLAWKIVTAIPNFESNPSHLLDAAYTRVGQEDFDDAARICDAVVELGYQSARLRNLQGILAFHRGDPDSATEAFHSAIELDPTFADAYANLATVSWTAEDQRRALQLYTRAFILSPLDMDITNLFEEATGFCGAFQDAEPLVDTMVTLYPRCQRLRYLQIEVSINLGRSRSALRLVQACIATYGIENGILTPALALAERVQVSGNRSEGKPNNSLAACMIVKDEENDIANCLHSVRDVVDEIVVVDTGSSDRTMDIAKVFGAKVIEVPWEGDFAAARNVYLKHATADWILVLDADEVVATKDHAVIRELIKSFSNQKMAFTVTTRNYENNSFIIGWSANVGEYPEEERGSGWIPTRKVRLFPNDPHLRYHFPVHEMLEPSLKEHGYTFQAATVPVHHYGKLNCEKVKRKNELYYDLGKRKLNENNENPYALRELAIQAGVMERYEEALQFWQRFIKLKPNIPEAYVCMTTAYIHLGEYQKALESAETGINLSPDFRETQYNYAIVLLHSGQAEKALVVIKRLCAEHESYLPARFVAVAAHFCCHRFKQGRDLLETLKKTDLGPVLDTSFESFVKELSRSHQATYAIDIIDAAKRCGYYNDGLARLRNQAATMIKKAG